MQTNEEINKLLSWATSFSVTISPATFTESNNLEEKIATLEDENLRQAIRIRTLQVTNEEHLTEIFDLRSVLRSKRNGNI